MKQFQSKYGKIIASHSIKKTGITIKIIDRQKNGLKGRNSIPWVGTLKFGLEKLFWVIFHE